MDADVQQDLKELAENIHDIAYHIESIEIDHNGLATMSDCLKISAETVDTYISILKNRQK